MLLAAGLGIGFFSGWYARPGGGDGKASRFGATSAGGLENLKTGELSSAHGEDGSRRGPRSTSRLESKQFANSVRSIFRETIEERRVAMFEKMLERVGVENYPEFVSLVRENDLRGSDTGVEWSRLWASWGRRDPAAAFAFMKDQDWSGWDPHALMEAKNRALTGWSQTNPDQARRFVEADSDFANGDRSMLVGLVRGWSDVDPQATAEWLSKNGLGMRDEYKAVVESISRKGGREALDAWFSTLDQSGAPSRDISGFAKEIAQIKGEYEPEKAAAWVEQHMGEAWLDESEIVQSTAHSFASRDPKGAMEWSARNGLENASMTAMATWVQQDLPSASAWMSENSQNPAYAGTAVLLLKYLQRSDPEAAKDWAKNLPDPAMRDRMLGTLGGK